MHPTRKNDLFILTGASGVGKSTVAEILFRQETSYIVLESDILWNDRFNTPDDNYHEYRELWMTLCYNISQIGMPVLLCGCATPEQLECCDARKYFNHVYYIAVVCDTDELEVRMREGRNIKDEDWLKGSKEFNNWLINYSHETEPNIKIINGTKKEPSHIAMMIDNYLEEVIK